MPKAQVLPSPSILNQAERELGAFLQAATNLVGPNGLSHARDLWIETLRNIDCPGTESTGFFRSVTIRTISQLAEDSANWAPSGMKTLASPHDICLTA
jgi:hypothetical protein